MFEFPPAARRSLAHMAGGCIAGALICGGVVITGAYLLNSRINEVLAAQATARAMDQVRLGILSRLRSDDFAAPHTVDKLIDIQERLDPALKRLGSDSSGLEGVDLIAGDGIIIYSDQAGHAGKPASHRERSALDQALGGRVATIVDTDDPVDQATNTVSDTTLDVYVPVVMDGVVVGAYEMDLATPVWRFNRSVTLLVLVLLGAAGGSIYLLWLARSVWRPAPAPVTPTNSLVLAAVENTLVLPPARSQLSLSPRELEVLGLLAGGHSYRAVAHQLVLSEETVRSHVKRILRKTGEANRTAAVAAALRAGVIKFPDSPQRVKPAGSNSPARASRPLSART